MARAEALCEQQGVRLTKVRKRVLELIWQSHQPTGAYDLLPKLAEEGFNSAPPTVYRALDFLLDLGLIHRLNSINAYTGCIHPGEQHPVCFFMCQNCGLAQELDAAPIDGFSQAIEQQLGVQVQQQIIELQGLCPACKATSADASNSAGH